MNERLEMIERRLRDMRRAFRWAVVLLTLTIGALGMVAGGGLGVSLAVIAITAVYVITYRVTFPMAGLIGLISQMAEEAEKRRTHDTLHDRLTGLPNRTHLLDHLDRSLAAASRGAHRVGICLIDLKGLRRVNEAQGAAVADLALRRCAAIVRMETRKGDFVARVSGDEFIIVAPDIEDPGELTAMASRVTRAIRRPFDVGYATLEFGCSAGVIHSEIGEIDPDRLLADAALALRAAIEKSADFILFDADLRENFEAQIRLRTELSDALAKGQIQPWFQPQIDARTGAAVGMEALARWIHPERGVLGPADFFDIADEFGLMDKIDEVILDASLDALIVWRKAGLEALRVGVNVSARRLGDQFLAERVKWALEARDLDPEDLCIEVLESVLIDDADCEVAKTLNSLSRLGVGVDLDDFGTGHASISTLKRIKVDRIKIDRSFISEVDRDERQRKVAQTMIDLAASVGVKALAEGVETAGEKTLLAKMGCDELQGYLIARPMPVEDAAEWLGAKSQEIASITAPG
ncbi:MAG: bifunctional diguanylate cyclase/phosphodiesterase [Pseudomonadota bacterium]